MDEPRSRIYAGFRYDAGSTPKSCAYVANIATEVKMRWNNTDGVELMRILRQGFVVSWNETEESFFYGPEYNKKTCSLLKHCWGSAKSNFKYVMRHNYSSIGVKLHYFFSIQTSFVECFQQPPGFAYPNQQVVFAFMVILVVLLDILLVLLGSDLNGCDVLIP
ncbi:hypothetical protein FCM35_KLT19848 [Carex littledalei]|uniref:Uncharacterized protein n=1 Tax=Carex littledalei TaxID=544730 RepID=A0A833R9E2_9POAL|nr:hypothetical protein FCM35_KLT19848 [Carex littledalei]